MRAWVAALLLLASFACAAHKASDSYLTLQVQGTSVTGQWDIALRDLNFALDLDADGDGAITWGEVRARHGEIAAFALGVLTLKADGAACTLTAARHLVDNHSDGAYAVMALAGTCPAEARALEVDYRLLFERDAQHRGLLKLDLGQEVRSAIFSADRPSQSFATRDASRPQQFAAFVADGVKHMATGIDHILFLLALLLPAVLIRKDGRWEPAGELRTTLLKVTGIVTAFTVAHSITLTLATLGIASLPSRWVEAAIAASVLLTAIDNLVAFLPRRRWIVALAFGLLHGFGFASVLIDLQLPASSLALSLLGFNLGVEIGQLAVVAVFVPLAFLARGLHGYRRLALGAGSALIALVSLGWLVERAFLIPFMPI